MQLQLASAVASKLNVQGMRLLAVEGTRQQYACPVLLSVQGEQHPKG